MTSRITSVAIREAPEAALQIAVTKLVKDHPYYSSLLLALPLIATERIPSFATCGSAIYYNRDFVSDSSISDLIFILIHELEHIVRSHAERQGYRVRLIWNIATDYGINQDLIDYGLKPPKRLGRMIGLYDPSFRNLSSEAIYARISDVFRKGAGLWKDSQVNEQRLKELDPLAGDVFPQLKQTLENSSMVGDIVLPDNACLPSTRSLVSRAAVTQSDQIPEHLKKRLGIRKPVDWTNQLEDYVRSRVRKGADWRQLNRRTRHLGIKMPGGFGPGLDSIALILDISGSMIAQLADFLRTLDDILTGIAPRQVISLLIDSEIKAAHEGDWQSVLIDLEREQSAYKGGGGTDLRPAFSALEELDWPPDVVICLTDMESDWPKFFQFEDRTVFVTTKSNSNPPFGEMVKID